MKHILFYLLLLPSFSFAEFVAGDGTLDFACRDADTTATPYNYFNLTLMYNNASGKSGFDLISDESLSSGDGNIVYQMQMVQFPFFGAETLAVPQSVPGCSAAPLTMKVNETNGSFEIYFECDADGDAGHGQLSMSLDGGMILGSISFPEGQSQLINPIKEDSTVQVICDHKDL